MKNEHCGAFLERGVVEKIEDGRYRVASITRDGIRSLPMRTLWEESISVGDIVYFFSFPDGDGIILTKQTREG